MSRTTSFAVTAIRMLEESRVLNAAHRWFDREGRRGSAIRFLVVALDMLAFNVSYFLFLKALVLLPTGFSSPLNIALWGIVFVGALAGSRILIEWRPGKRFWPVHLELLLFVALAGFTAYIAGAAVIGKGDDWSWIRVEMIKVPLWLYLHATLSPVFTALFAAGSLAGLWFVASKKRRLTVAAVATGLLAVYAAIVVHRLSVYPAELEGIPHDIKAIAFYYGYIAMFCFPGLLLCVMLWLRARTWAARTLPLVLDMTLIAMNYLGVLPIYPIHCADVPFGLPALREQTGVSIILKAEDTKLPTSFVFLRKTLLTDDRLIFNYGPTCGLYSVPRDGGSYQWRYVRGLMRDLEFSPDRRFIWGLNWQFGDMSAFSTQTLEPAARCDFFSLGLATPWDLLVEGDRVYASNVTFPLVMELRYKATEDACEVAFSRVLDFYAKGYTRFTDGAYGMFLDEQTNRLYVLVALLGGRNEAGLVEVDLDRFVIARDVRVPGASHVLPLGDRGTAIVTGYWTGDAVEVSTRDMKVVRRFDVDPNVLTSAYDEKRSIWFALSRAGGTLEAIDMATGTRLGKWASGAKPSAVVIDPQTDELFFGSGDGIYRIRLPEFLASLGPSKPLNP